MESFNINERGMTSCTRALIIKDRQTDTKDKRRDGRMEGRTDGRTDRDNKWLSYVARRRQ